MRALTERLVHDTFLVALHARRFSSTFTNVDATPGLRRVRATWKGVTVSVSRHSQLLYMYNILKHNKKVLFSIVTYHKYSSCGC